MSNIQRLPAESRQQLASLLNQHSPADATAAYYALEHPADRVDLYAEYAPNGTPRGFVALAQTGLDLFRRLVIPFSAHPIGLVWLLQACLRPKRPELLMLPVEQEGWLAGMLDLSDRRVNDLYRLHPASFSPIPNVLVVPSESPGGGLRFEIRGASGARAAAGVNWQGPRYAEIYLEADQEARARGFARSVLAAMAGHLLSDRKISLYRISQDDAAAQADAFQVGFRRTGDRTLLAQGIVGEGTEEIAP